jgi:hypothetical protein
MRGETHIASAVVVMLELLRRFVPMIITMTPAVPPHGAKYVMVGEQPPGFALVKSVELLAVALALVTWIVPLASPATVAHLGPRDDLERGRGRAADVGACHHRVLEVRS